MVQAGRHLGQQDRVAQGQDDTGGAKCDPSRAARKKAEIREGVEDLPRIPEAWIVDRHIPEPDRIKAKALCQLHAPFGVCDVRHAKGATLGTGTALPGFGPVAVQWQFNAKTHAVFVNQIEGRHDANLLFSVSPRRISDAAGR